MATGPTVRRRRLGTELRKLRESNGYKLEEVAAQLGVAPSTLSRIETGKAPTGNPVTVANVKFYQEHLAEIEPINERMQKLAILHDEGEGEDEASDD